MDSLYVFKKNVWSETRGIRGSSPESIRRHVRFRGQSAYDLLTWDFLAKLKTTATGAARLTVTGTSLWANPARNVTDTRREVRNLDFKTSIVRR